MERLREEMQRPETGAVLSCQVHGSHNGDDDDPEARRLSGADAGGLLAMPHFVQAGLVRTVGHIRSLP
jgi:predicted dehydrogenase